MTAADTRDRRTIRPEDLDAPLPPPRRSWFRRYLKMLIVCGVLLVLVGGEYAASRVVASKLRSLVARKLDARLDTGSLIYVPPYGATAWGVRLLRDEKELVTVGRADIRLTQLPLGRGPIIISSVTVDRPVLNESPGAFARIVKPH